MQILLFIKILAQFNPGTSHAIKNPSTCALVTQTYMYKNFKKCKYSNIAILQLYIQIKIKKYSQKINIYLFRRIVIRPPPHNDTVNTSKTLCSHSHLYKKSRSLARKLSSLTGTLQSTGKVVSALLIKKVNSLYQTVLIHQQEEVQQLRDGNTGKKAFVLYIKVETSLHHPVISQQQEELQQTQDRNAIHSKDTGTNILLSKPCKLQYAHFGQIKNTINNTIKS